MAVIASKPKGKKANVIIGDATDRLLRSVKDKMLREKGKIDYHKLAQDL